MYGPAERLALFAEADFVVCTLPGTAANQKFCGASEFAAMKASAVFINIGRGSTVDEDALVSVLKAGSIRGAALDVFESEPLDPASEFWALDNVLLSPHNADYTHDYFEQGWRVWRSSDWSSAWLVVFVVVLGWVTYAKG